MHSNSINHIYDSAKILIIGAGAFGTALAVALQNGKNHIYFVARESDRLSMLKNTEQSESIIKGFQTFEEFNGNLLEFDLIIFAIPAQALRSVLTTIKEKFVLYCEQNSILMQNLPKLPFISTSKGIEQDSIKLPHEIFDDVWGNQIDIATLSGPSFAKEMLLKLPACLTFASSSETLIKKSISFMHSSNFRIYDSNDLIGAEVGGALKNVVAILVGMVDGLGLGYNAQTAVITLGLSDIAHIGVCMGASSFTFLGLSGLGDLILTCTGNLSRNKQFGYRYACGETKEAIMSDMGGVVEGFETSKSAYQLIKKLGISSVLFKVIYEILYENLPLQEAIEIILNCKQGSELPWLNRKC